MIGMFILTIGSYCVGIYEGFHDHWVYALLWGILGSTLRIGNLIETKE
jgi:hypothetical protein